MYLGLKNYNSENTDSGQNPNSVSLVRENGVLRRKMRRQSHKLKKGKEKNFLWVLTS